MRILLVEDDTKIATFVKKGLEQSGHAVVQAPDGEEGYQLASTGSFDAAIFDIMLPHLDGLTAIERLRANNSELPILILSAKHLVSDRVKGLSIGGDDYLTKPFSFSELLARLEALVRRASKGSASIERTVGDLTLNVENRRVFRGSNEILLQPKEFDLLRYLVDNQDRVVSKTMIMENVWNYNFDPATNIVETRICKLRDKIDRDYEVKLIYTLRGVGYVLRATP